MLCILISDVFLIERLACLTPYILYFFVESYTILHAWFDFCLIATPPCIASSRSWHIWWFSSYKIISSKMALQSKKRTWQQLHARKVAYTQGCSRGHYLRERQLIQMQSKMFMKFMLRPFHFCIASSRRLSHPIVFLLQNYIELRWCCRARITTKVTCAEKWLTRKVAHWATSHKK